MSQPNHVFLVLSVLCISARLADSKGGAKKVTGKVPALFVFGDSIVFPGNNNHIPIYI